MNQPPDSAPFSDARPVRLWQLLDDDDLPSLDEPYLQALGSAYRSLNRQPVRLASPPIVPGLEVTLVNEQSQRARPVVYLSRPAINVTGDSAIVRITEICGGLCGQGALVLLVRSFGRWRVVTVLEVTFS